MYLLMVHFYAAVIVDIAALAWLGFMVMSFRTLAEAEP